MQDMLDGARQLVDGSRIYVMLDLAPGATSALEGKPGRIWGDTGLIGRPPVRVAPQCEAARLLSLPIPEPAGDTDLGFLIVENRPSDRMLR
ncbi:hypothetical protein LZ189_28015, partial [Rhodovulum sulfidophilum]|nr:hypothetical protein [Rhodovulum sulfidophilum]